jgi:hypothetical protein
MARVTLKFPNTYRINKVTYRKDETVEMPEEDAALLADDEHFHIEGVSDAALKTALEGVGQGADRKERITAAISGLDVDVDENFDVNGLPTVEALSQALGEVVTVEERDAAMVVTTDNPDAAPIKKSRIIKKSAQTPDDTTGAVEI